MDYNAPPNSCTFGKAQQEFGLSSGLSNFTKISIPVLLYFKLIELESRISSRYNVRMATVHRVERVVER